MSADLLYRAFGIAGYRVTQTSWEEDSLVLCLEQPRQTLRCSACSSRNVHRKGSVSREFKTLPIGSQAVRLQLAVPRVLCRSCRLERQVSLDLAEPKKTFTKCFARYVLELAQLMTVNDVARHLDVSWELVRGIVGDDLQRQFGRPKLKHLRRIAIDEIYIGKTHKFLTIVLDLDSGRIVFVGDGKGENALTPFWKRLRHARAKIEAVVADLSPAYDLAIRTALPEATLVFDRFHLVKLLNEHLTELRRELQREAEEGLQKQVLKGTRWLLLKHPANLDDTRNERQRLDEALRLNESLATAYYLKEDLRQIWEQRDKHLGELVLERWIRMAEATGIRQMQKFAKTLRKHRQGILAWYDHPISTGPLEGTNNKIKLLQRQAFGYRDKEFFKLRLLGLHRSKHALVG